MEQPSPRIGNWVALLVGAIGLLFVVVLLHEWWIVGIQRDPNVIKAYPFAAENVLGDGGWNYSNPELYAWWALGSAGFVTCATVLLAVAVRRKSWRLAIAAGAVCAAFWMTSEVLERQDWARRRSLSDATALSSARVPSNPALQPPPQSRRG